MRADRRRANLHAPVVFSELNRFVRAGSPAQENVYKSFLDHKSDQGNKTLSFLRGIAKTADDSSAKLCAAVKDYRTPVSYGLESISSTLSTDFAGQAGAQQQQLMYVADALEGFAKDMKRIGRGSDVAMMMFTEFGRRVAENQSGGADHGTATPMYLIGEKVKPGPYSTYPSLTDLDSNGDLRMTTDFRSVYANMIKEWMGYGNAKAILKDDFKTLGAFA